MSVPFSNLSEENHEQIRKYLRFLRNKKDGILRSLQREIEDIRSDRLTEDMYSRDDVNEFVDFLTSAIKVPTCLAPSLFGVLTVSSLHAVTSWRRRKFRGKYGGLSAEPAAREFARQRRGAGTGDVGTGESERVGGRREDESRRDAEGRTSGG